MYTISVSDSLSVSKYFEYPIHDIASHDQTQSELTMQDSVQVHTQGPIHIVDHFLYEKGGTYNL